MDWDEILSTGLKALAALGGVGVVAGAVAAWTSNHLSASWLQTHKGELDKQLETHKFELARESETHKLSLRRQELMFGRELEAADAFMLMYRNIWPQYRNPEMDWDDASEDVASRFAEVEVAVDQYLSSHSSVIGNDVRGKIERIRTLAAQEKFGDRDGDHEFSQSTIKAGGSVLDLLHEAKDQILADLRR